MNKVYVGIGFALGLVIGASATYFLLKKKSDEQVEKDTASIKKVYHLELDRLNSLKKELRGKAEKLSEKYSEDGLLTPNPSEDVVGKVEQTPYHRMGDHPTEEDFDENGQPYDPDGTSVLDGYIHDDVPDELADQYVGPRPANCNVYFIDERVYAGDPHYEKFQITYYEIDGVWADESDEVLEPNVFLSERVDMVKEILELLVTEDAVYVRNNGCQADYEIVALETSYAEMVGGKR